MITSVTVRGKTPGEQAFRDLDIYLDSTEEGPSDWVFISIRQPSKNEPFATVRVQRSEIQQALGILFGSGERSSRDARDAATLAQAAEHLNREMAEVLEFQEDR